MTMTMKKHIFGLLLIATAFGACNKSDIDRDFAYDHNQIEDDNLKVYKDTTGVEYFAASKYLVINRKENRVYYYLKQAGLLEIAPVILPEGDNTVQQEFSAALKASFIPVINENTWVGNPHAVRLDNGNILLAAERRVNERLANSYSDNIFVVRNQEKQNLSVENFARYAPYGNNLINTSLPMMAKNSDGVIVVKTKGMLVSEDDGASWTHYPHAFDAINNSGKYFINIGGSLAALPNGEFIVATDHSRNMGDPEMKPITPSRILRLDPESGTSEVYAENWVPKYRRSEKIWMELTSLSGITFYDPVALGYTGAPEGAIVGFGLEKNKVFTILVLPDENGNIEDMPSLDDYANTVVDDPETEEIESDLSYVFDYKSNFYIFSTNIVGTALRHSGVGLIYNPMTNRFELIHSSPYNMDLWSIDADALFDPATAWSPETFYKMPWIKETDLIIRDISLRGYGMYPLTSYVDNTAQKIHTFFDAGDEYPGRSGVFEMIRTLNTPVLVDSLAKRRKIANGQRY